jgi:hypothetical protein
MQPGPEPVTERGFPALLGDERPGRVDHRIVLRCSDPERDPLGAELFESPPAMKDGMQTLNEEPGLGPRLSVTAMAKFGEWVM